MSILIKGMEMPKNCRDCVLLTEAYYCPFTGATQSFKDVRHKNCPLIEVPPHGDLIEKNIIEKAINDACDECKDACIEFDGFFADCNQCIFHGVKKALIDTPTNIPAEEDGEA